MKANVTKKDLQKALAQTANKKIENSEKLTEKEVEALQTTAQDRQLAFCDSFKKALAKRKDVDLKKVSSKNNCTIKTADNVTAEICRKERYTAIYTVRCTDKTERDKLLKSFKDSKELHTCTTKKYLDSKETRIELILESNEVNKAFIDNIVTACNELAKTRKAMKKAK